MKVIGIILKILAALAAVLGAITVLSLYGDKIVAWCKKVVIVIPDEDEVPIEKAEPAAEEAAEEAVEEEAPVEEVVIIEENEPVAEEADFEA